MALLVGQTVVLSRFLSVSLPTIKIGFAFVPLALCGALYGPICTLLVAVVADILGALLFPQGTFFIGFTISAAMTGFIYGIFFNKKSKSIVRIVLAVTIVTVLVHICANTLWLSILLGKGFLILLPSRLIKNFISLVTEICILYSIYPLFEKMQKSLLNS